MHRHKTVAQILLILSILNSTLAAPMLLQKRPNEPQAATPVVPDAPPSINLPSSSQPQFPHGHQPSSSMTEYSGYLDYTETPSGNLKLIPPTVDTGHSEIRPYTSAPADPQHGAIQPYTTPPAPASPQHGEIQPHTSAPGSPEHGEIQPHTSPPASPAHPAPQSMTTPPQPVNKAPSQAAWRQKIMTPEKIKATKYAAGAFILTAAYMGLLFPEIMSNDNTKQGD